MALFENFPYTNLHELNLGWIIDEIQKVKNSVVLSVNGQTGEVVLYQNAEMVLPNVTADHWSILRMADGTHRGIMFANDGTAYIVSGGMMNHIYSVGNEPPYPVLSVNGMNGQIELYTEQYVRLPNLTGTDLINWNFYRTINNVIHGIQFETNGKAYIMHGSNRYQIYDSNDQPPYPVTSVDGQTGDVSITFPVTSVNGQTGDVEVYTEESEGYITFPAVESDDIDQLIFTRSLNNIEYGLVFTDTGVLKLKIGNTEYNIYTEYDPGLVDSATDNNLNFAHDSTGTSWGLMRDTTIGPVGILFSNVIQNAPDAYIRYRDSNNQIQTTKLLTLNDIPSSSGVVSVNGLNGVVVLTLEDIRMSSVDTRVAETVLTDLEDDVSDFENAMVYVETGNSATQNIPANSFVYWKGQPYISSAAIAINDILSSSNLANLTTGNIVNDIYNNILPADITSTINFAVDAADNPIVDNYTGTKLYKIGFIRVMIVSLRIKSPALDAHTAKTILSLGSADDYPAVNTSGFATGFESTGQVYPDLRIAVNTLGNMSITCENNHTGNFNIRGFVSWITNN